ncbi:hypothetical protein SAMN05444920_101700 [Nonomuraea solani]|uniref:Uncharacterized protein n=1 Tax=Nonomuraea solani TaxID=1144553 RepID=A0A1H5V063_9ACTN|nr:hypothetical protein [Nonomuraea solani]SEF80091.1 hypothetical protein SAMN05444920_101700 [Nonomuraea solani]
MAAPEGDEERPQVGRSYLQREQNTKSYEGGGSGTEYDFEADTIEDAYADHLVDYGKGAYPGQPYAQAPDLEGKKLLADHPVNPGAAKRELFIDLDAYEDPATGKARPTSPVERLRADLARLQGEGEGTTGIKALLDLSRLDQRDLGSWEAADDLLATTVQAQATLEGATRRVWTVYAAVVEALDQTVKSAKAADGSVANDLRTRT